MGTFYFCDDCHDYNAEAEAEYLRVTVKGWREPRDLCEACYKERKRMGLIEETPITNELMEKKKYE
jgi:hypothetical protein